MKMKVVCQRCGKTETINTEQDNTHKWRLTEPTEYGINEVWDLWLCWDCFVDIDIKENYDEFVKQLGGVE